MPDVTTRDVGHNIFLDFLNRDSRQIYGLYRHIQKSVHLQTLGHVLNLAAFVTRDHCVMPPGFLAEDQLVREILEIKRAYRDERLIQLPIRESLDEYWAKKEREYASVRGQYSGLFSREGHRFVEDNAHLLIDRPFAIGSQLLSRWEEAPDASGYWHSRFHALAPSVVELFRRVPNYIAEDGGAITWETISARIPEVARRHPEYRKLVQNIYFGLYIESLDLRILTSLPYARDDFGLGSGDLFYDYNGMRALIEPSGLWDRLLNLSAWDVLALRKTPGYFEFRRSARELIDRSSSYYQLRRHMALPRSDLDRIIASTSDAVLLRGGRGQLILPFEDVDTAQLEAFSYRMARVVQLGLERSEGERNKAINIRLMYESFKAEKEAALVAPKSTSNLVLGIFAALPEEREVLARELKLTPAPGSAIGMRGVLPDGTRAILYGGRLMGRVPATAETSYLLARELDVSMILVVGLAGGFAEKDVKQGHFLVPSQIADLASRKVTSVDDATDARVRPQAWELDQRLGDYLEMQMGDEWLTEACDRYDWPKDRRPMLRIGGTMVCLDEVVADESYRKKLQTAWGDQLLGVEMESGGVIAAARRFKGLSMPIFQIRAVSDTADPAKSDDAWRRLGMQTICSLVRGIVWQQVLTSP